MRFVRKTFSTRDLAPYISNLPTGDKHTTNLAFAGDGYLYITGMDYLSRIPVLAKPQAPWEEGEKKKDCVRDFWSQSIVTSIVC